MNQHGGCWWPGAYQVMTPSNWQIWGFLRHNSGIKTHWRQEIFYKRKGTIYTSIFHKHNLFFNWYNTVTSHSLHDVSKHRQTKCLFIFFSIYCKKTYIITVFVWGPQYIGNPLDSPHREYVMRKLCWCHYVIMSCDESRYEEGQERLVQHKRQMSQKFFC